MNLPIGQLNRLRPSLVHVVQLMNESRLDSDILPRWSSINVTFKRIKSGIHDGPSTSLDMRSHCHEPDKQAENPERTEAPHFRHAPIHS